MMKLMRLFDRTFEVLFLFSFLITTLIAQNSDPLIDAYDLYENGQYKKALEICKPLVETDRSYTAAVFLLGRIYFASGSVDSAIVYIEKAIDLDKHNKEYRDAANSIQDFSNMLRDASRAFNIADYEEANSLYEQAIEKNPNFADAYYSLAKVNIRLDNVSKAAENFRKAIELNPAETRYRKGYEELVARFLSEGNQLYKRRNYKAAEEKLKQAINLNPEEFMAYYLLGVVQLATRDLDEALESIKKCIELNDEYAKAYLVCGKIFQRLNNSADALNSYEKAVEVDPNYSDAWLNIGTLCFKKKDFEKAITAYTKVIELKPEYSKTYGNLGAVYIETNRYKNAIDYLKKAVELDPRSHISWLRLSQAYNKTGNCNEARESAKSALKVKVNWAPALVELGMAERCLGNMSAAKQAFQLAMRDPRWKKVAQHELKTVQ